MLSENTLSTLSLFILLSLASYLMLRQTVDKGYRPRIRTIPGLLAIEEFVGRAAEMGRPVHFSSGLSGLTSSTGAQTVAATSILSEVAKFSAEKGSKLVVSVRPPDSLALQEETVRQRYMEQGKPEEFIEGDTVRFLSDNQMAFAAGVLGFYNTEKPATNILIGGWYGELIIIAEAGARSGAAQIGGTARVNQFPMFAFTSEYVLFGEEMFAGGAYLTQDPKLLSIITVQDFGKILSILLIFLGYMLEKANIHIISSILNM